MIVSSAEEYQYYSFDPAWDTEEAMASMRNGSGDDWFCWFGAPGAAIVGFDHESPMSPYAREPRGLWPGLTDGIPEAFVAPVLKEPAFSIEDSTFVVWREPDDEAWRSGPVELPDGSDPDGAAWLLELLLRDDPTAYLEFAADYYEVGLDRTPVQAVWCSQALTDELVSGLNPRLRLADVRPDVSATGYPLAEH